MTAFNSDTFTHSWGIELSEFEEHKNKLILESMYKDAIQHFKQPFFEGNNAIVSYFDSGGWGTEHEHGHWFQMIYYSPVVLVDDRLVPIDKHDIDVEIVDRFESEPREFDIELVKTGDDKDMKQSKMRRVEFENPRGDALEFKSRVAL